MGFGISSEMMGPRVAAVGAMVVCFAVVLGAGRLNREGGPVALRSEVPSFISVPIADLQPETAPQPEQLQLVQAQLVPAELVQSQSVQSEPVQPEPVEAEPVQAEPVQAEPVQHQPLLPVVSVAEYKVVEADARPLASAEVPASVPISAEFSDAAMVGVWAPDAGSCSLREFRQGLLPTIINAHGAWAGETFCSFKNVKRTDAGWRMVATCTNADHRWTTPVQMTIKGDRLIWASKRGTQAYTRCAPGFRVTAAR